MLLSQYKTEVEYELKNILQYWQEYAIDSTYGGFSGKINNENQIFPQAQKGAVLNARILWTFSAAASFLKDEAYKKTAERAFNYFKNFFLDKKNGGVYWIIDHEGKPLDTRKQIYALAFAVYGLSEYSKASGNVEAKKLAIDMYHDIVSYSYDQINGGYIEALTEDWEAIDDLRLSDKDANERKSMNTHLHIVEGFANLYSVWPDEDLKFRITEILKIFCDHIIDERCSLNLFFDDQWNVKSHKVSFGHNIEAAWLLLEVAHIIQDQQWVQLMEKISVSVARTVMPAIDSDGGVWNEYDIKSHQVTREKDWWPQAEAMVGFLNAYQLTGDEDFLNSSLNSWHFIQQNIIDKKNGEWFWGIGQQGETVNEDKVGLWKCPYHNSRACMEVIKRVSELRP